VLIEAAGDVSAKLAIEEGHEEVAEVTTTELVAGLEAGEHVAGEVRVLGVWAAAGHDSGS
jgi:hypothetical protein